MSPVLVCKVKTGVCACAVLNVRKQKARWQYGAESVDERNAVNLILIGSVLHP